MWFGENMNQWTLGGWLWLLAIFAWMTLLVTFMYTYTPVHRVSTNLQSGLMIIAAVLLILGVLVWMSLLPQALSTDWQEFVNHMALTFLSGGLFMGGGVTAWISIDLAMLRKLPRLWMAPGVLAGLLVVPSPFLFPSTNHLLIALAVFCLWCGMLGIRRTMPAPYPELNVFTGS